MAATNNTVLEKQAKRFYTDDTILLSATIVQYRTVTKGSYVEYDIRVHGLLSPAEEWTVQHRYSDFAALHQALSISGLPLQLPPKKTFGNTERQFLQVRQEGLQKLLNEILKDPFLRNSLIVKRFLDPENYSDNFYEIALRNVSMFFRSEPNWQVVEPLRDIGWRFRKQYFLISNKADPKVARHILSWCEPGPDFSLGERELEAAIRLLGEIKHPHILPTVSASYNGTGLMVVRQFFPQGSLRDLIYGSRPHSHVLQKYGQPARSQLPLASVKKYGRQVLEALSFLQEKGYVMGHVHAGNVLVDKTQGCCKLVDIENSLLGLPTLHRAFLLDIRKIYTHEAETVYCFGHMLHEMCCGCTLKVALMEECLPHTPKEAAPLLQALLTAQGIKNNLPSIAELLANPFFADIPTEVIEKPSLRVPSRLKEVLKAHLEKAEVRLHDQQRKVAHHRRVSRAHDSLMSEDEKKKRKKKLKKQMKSMDEGVDTEAYPTTTSLPRSSTIGTTSVRAPRSKSTVQANGPAQTAQPSQSSSVPNSGRKSSGAPPPPKTPAAAPQPPPSRQSNERGALLTSIESFSKGKLKKSVTNDRSAPKVGR